MITVLRSLAGDCDGAVGGTCLNLGIYGKSCGFLVTLPSDVRREVDDIGILGMNSGCSSDPDPSLVAYCRSSEVYWAFVERAQRCYTYRFPHGM